MTDLLHQGSLTGLLSIFPLPGCSVAESASVSIELKLHMGARRPNGRAKDSD